MKKILLPIDFPSISMGVVHQAAYLARHFKSEIVLLHVVTPLRYPAGFLEQGHELTARDLHAAIIQHARKNLDLLLHPELDGIAVKRVVLRGEPAHEIIRAARDENVDLIAMATQGLGPVFRLLLGSVTAKVLHDVDCAVWTSHHQEGLQAREFTIRKILCAVDLTQHSRATLSKAAKLADEFGAQLTLVHITAGVKAYGPGGSYVLPEWKEALVSGASRDMAKLQQEVGTQADVIIECGDVHQMLSQAAETAGCDLLVIGHTPPAGHLGANGAGYSIVRESRVPVLSL